MFFASRTLSLPKDPAHADDYQDAVAVDASTGRAAIADGVSSSLFAGRWARILARAAIDNPPPADRSDDFASWLLAPRAQWSQAIDPAQLAWHQRSRLQDGAFSTLLWMQLAPSSRDAEIFELTAQAIGDSCLFVIRPGEPLTAFPLQRSAEFGAETAAVGSVDRRADPLPEPARGRWECRADDWLALATDAVAAWILAEAEAGRAVDWQSWWNGSTEDWQARMLEERRGQSLRHDDATAVLLRIERGGVAAGCQAPNAPGVEDF
jgi:hypothetical protein